MIGDLLDTPDPYISVYVSCAAKKTRKTKHFNNIVNPNWNEELRFHVPPLALREDDKIVISLMGTVVSSSFGHNSSLIERRETINKRQKLWR